MREVFQIFAKERLTKMSGEIANLTLLLSSPMLVAISYRFLYYYLTFGIHMFSLEKGGKIFFPVV